MSPTTIKNIGSGPGPTPLAILIAHSLVLRTSSPVNEYLSNSDRVLLAQSNSAATKDFPLVGNVWSF